MAGAPGRWWTFAAAALLAAATVLLAFVILERAWPALTPSQRMWLHAVRGAGVGMAVAGMATWVLRREAHKLQETFAALGAILESCGEGVLGTDRQGRCTFVNRKGARMLGYSPEEMVGQVMHEQIHARHADGSRHDQANCPIERAAMLGESRRVIEDTFWRKDHAPLPVEYVAEPIRVGNTWRGASVVFQDITERKARQAAREAQAKQAFQILDGLPVAAFAIDVAGQPVYANDAAQRLLGKGILPADTQNLGTVYPTYIAGTDTPYPADRLPIIRALAGEARITATDLELARDGKRTPLEVWATPLLDDAGEVSHAVAVFFDISDRLRAEQERAKLVRREEELRQSKHFERMQARFIDHAAHQLYTPLTPLKIQVAVAAKKLDAGEAGILQRNVDRLHALVSQVLHVAKSQAGIASLHRERVPLHLVVKDAMEQVRHQAAKREVTIRETSAAGEVVGDRARLAEALYHLLDNAVKFSRPGQQVSVDAQFEAGQPVIEVADSGKGWAQGDDERMFEPFVQGPDVADLGTAGWGLGLFLAQSICHAHGGTLVGASPGAGKGAVFRMRLPPAPR